MRNPNKLKMERSEREARIVEAAFDLFVENKIEGTSFQAVADAAGVGVATVFRYYPDKIDLAIKVCTSKWNEILGQSTQGRPLEVIKDIPAIERLDYTLTRYIALYEKHKSLLLFNDNFNHYIVHEHVSEERLEMYHKVMDKLTERFHLMYEKAKEDKSFRTDLPEDELRRITLHTMMSACNHYAGGIIWGALGSEEEYIADLYVLKDMIINFVKK